MLGAHRLRSPPRHCVHDSTTIMSFITYRHIYALVSAILLIVSFCTGVTHATPALLPRDPYFPNDPPSCPICAQNYDGISSCAQAAPVLANASMVRSVFALVPITQADVYRAQILFNPGAFIDVIKCACTDSFQSGKYHHPARAVRCILRPDRDAPQLIPSVWIGEFTAVHSRFGGSPV